MPVLRRPHRVAPLLESIFPAVSVPTRVLFITNPDDCEERAAVAPWCSVGMTRSRIEMLDVDGNYAAKINAGVRATNEPLLFLGADDLHFHPGWFEAAVALLVMGIGVVGTNDLCNPRVIAGDHATHCLVTREYAQLGTIDELDKLLHEGYPHEFVDDEFVGTAKHRGAYAHAPDSIVEHLHPMVGKAPSDDIYAAQRGRMREGRPIFNARRPLWM